MISSVLRIVDPSCRSGRKMLVTNTSGGKIDRNDGQIWRSFRIRLGFSGIWRVKCNATTADYRSWLEISTLLLYSLLESSSCRSFSTDSGDVGMPGSQQHKMRDLVCGESGWVSHQFLLTTRHGKLSSLVHTDLCPLAILR